MVYMVNLRATRFKRLLKIVSTPQNQTPCVTSETRVIHMA